MEENESTIKNQTLSGRGGARPGAGRPKGSLEPKTVERNAAKDAFIARVASNADQLFNAQFNKAIGETYLMWRHKVGSGNKERTVVEVVDDLEVIKQYLNDELDTDGDEYYYVSTHPADNMAISDMLNRGFGKPTEKIETDITTNGESVNQVDTNMLTQFLTNVQDGTKR